VKFRIRYALSLKMLYSRDGIGSMEDLNDIELGPYRVENRIGAGGMATVFKAYQSNMGRYVALKILSQELSRTEEFVSRFTREARVIGSLQHPYILPVYDFGEAKGYIYLAMRLVENGSLSDLIRSYTRFDLPKASDIVRQLGSALEYAHKKGVIHRDFKPSNVLIDEFENCLLSDFGIAKLAESSTNLTATGRIMGTPTFLSPEQGSGKHIDERSDIYSLGIVIYQMLTGEVPFKADTPLGVIYKHIHEPLPAPSSVVPGLPEPVEKVILKALAKDPQDRYRSAGDLVKDFEAAAAPFAMQTHPTICMGSFSDAGKASEPQSGKKKGLLGHKWLIPALVVLIIAIAAAFLVPKFLKPGVGKDHIALISAGIVEVSGKNPKGQEEFRHKKDKAVAVLIPGGQFVMGSDQYSYEKPVQTITLKSYLIDKYPVTNRQYEQFVQQTKHVTDAEKNGYGNVLIGRHWRKVKGATWSKPDGVESIEGKENHPVRQISYNDALAYCQWAGKDLPTEAQWEKAARGPQGYKYPWGDSDPNDTLANYDNSIGSTTPVDRYEKGQSFYGCFNMAGNTYEWCKDWYTTYSEAKRVDTDPAGPDKGSERVVKGGCYVEGMESLRSAHRDRFDPNYSSTLISFRTVCNPVKR
jgi:serine/threonine protein kinase